MQACRPQRSVFPILLQHCSSSFEKSTVDVQPNRGMAARLLQGTGNVGMLEDFNLPDFLLAEHVAWPVFLERKIHRSKRAGRIRIGFTKPRRAAIFGLKNFQNLIPGSRNCFSLPTECSQLLLNSLFLVSGSGNFPADL